MSNGQRVDATVERIERASAVLRAHGLDTLNITEGWSSPLRSGTPGPKSVGTISDPTGNAATAERDDREARAYRDLCDDLDALEIAAARVTHAVIRYRRLSPKEAKALFSSVRGRQSSLPDCACLNCEDKAEPGSPHCGPCHRYLVAHPGNTQVPRYVILGRERERGRRERTRGYVTGPLVEAAG